MALTAEARRKPLMGHDRPRLAPPTPARSDLAGFKETVAEVGIEFLPWQDNVGLFLYALGQGDRWLFPEVAAIVARQNGKTEIVKPHIIKRLKMKRHILHAAQTRGLPRRMFYQWLVPVVTRLFPDAIIRRAAGYESIEIPGGGSYTITAATGPGPRGLTIDDLIVDELREIDEEFIGAVLPTMAASQNPQALYLSNAGTASSVALNAVRSRADDDPALAYLEWSAGPDRAVDDPEGWAEANPAIGHWPMFLDGLGRAYRSAKLGGTLADFETERLCRWVVTTNERLVDDATWAQCRAVIGAPSKPAIGVAMDPDGSRASIAIAWKLDDERVALTIVQNVSGDPVDTKALGETIKKLSLQHNAKVGFDAHTDGQLAKYVRKDHGENIVGQKAVAAAAEFARLVGRHEIAWSDADSVTDDLTWTVRSDPSWDGAWQAIRAKEDHPITASLATIRAVWLASNPRQPGGLRVH